ncbi:MULTISPECIES: imidazole glycerol phosphate synthase subunit HisH [Thermodesulfovibrio]|uniref:imidazole glycerol phosphate synthase subunit HisH n=1 Tax=Thermodesulfovibrio TaxID=28261 RepID=UPI00261F2451|nr:imidazole glycerol phosphate synthase subunit HisH [Thermodesulfovibrio sp.]
MKSIVIVNYGMGNINSITSAVRFLGYEPILSDKEEQILKAERIILPGVGSFYKAMQNIRQKKLDTIIKKAVLEKGIPLLGICLGMQLLFQLGTEDEETEGLGFIEGIVEKFNQSDKNVKIPHIGFSRTEIIKDSKIFKKLGSQVDFYYNHSFRALTQEKFVIALAHNGEKFTAAVENGNIFGTQFHPELSQSNGLRVIKNFLELKNAI